MFRKKNEFCSKKLAVLNQIKLIKPKQTDTWVKPLKPTPNTKICSSLVKISF